MCSVFQNGSIYHYGKKALSKQTIFVLVHLGPYASHGLLCSSDQGFFLVLRAILSAPSFASVPEFEKKT